MLLPQTMKCQRSGGFYPFLFVPKIMSMILDCGHPPPILSESPEVGIRTHSLEPHVSASLSGAEQMVQDSHRYDATGSNNGNSVLGTGVEFGEGNVTKHSHRRESGLISSSNATWLPH